MFVENGFEFSSTKKKSGIFKHYVFFSFPNAGVTRNIVLDKKGNISFLTRLYDEKEFSDMIDHVEKLLSK